ncbi:ferric reduction oxidase 7, chloroplastic-like [Salvia hispanica]|uniref:ferric reduction oxidase 7, chloroplastic-like n=1 Tax=Salvia hispanica TaxID=49212 RepID=UPI002009BADA|nr:ferric reduction oxidase 7, chloroplastic-like [Salvia hispanica]
MDLESFNVGDFHCMGFSHISLSIRCCPSSLSQIDSSYEHPYVRSVRRCIPNLQCLLIAFLASAYIYLRDEEDENDHGKKSSGKQARLRLWTMPILVDGPFGVVSAAEVIGIAVFTTYIVWSFYAEMVKNFEVLAFKHMPTHEER